MNQITFPFPIFYDSDGSPLNNGYVYIGESGLNAEVNPINIFWDSNLSIPASNPLRTLNGFIVNNGRASKVYTDGIYSILIKNKNGVLVTSSPSVQTSQFVEGSVININDYPGWDAEDATDAVLAALADVPTGGALYAPDLYSMSQELYISKPMTIYGNESGLSGFKFTGCHGIVIAHDGSALTSNVVRNLSITTMDSGIYTGLDFVGTESDGTESPQLKLYDVRIAGHDDINPREWLIALKLESADNAVLNSVILRGKTNAAISDFTPNTFGLYISNSTLVKCDALEITRVYNAVYLTGQSEGFYVIRSNIYAVDIGIKASDLVIPSNNFAFDTVHISANSKSFIIEPCTNNSNSFGHTFNNMFVLKRVEGTSDPGNDGYIAFDLAVNTSSFTGVITYTNSATKDHYTDGDKAFNFTNNATGNVFAAVHTHNPGIGFDFEAGCKGNNGSSITVSNSTAYEMIPIEGDDLNPLEILYDTGDLAFFTRSSRKNIIPSIRQTVLSGPVDANKLPSFLPATSTSLSITTTGISESVPFFVTAANGMDKYGNIDIVGFSDENFEFTGLFQNATNYLFVNLSEEGEIFTGKITLPPVYQLEGTPSTVNGQHTYIIKEGKMYVGNGTTAVEVTNRVFIGEAVTNATTVTSTVCYAYQGLYSSPQQTAPASTNTAYSVNHNLGMKPNQAEVVAICIEAEGDYAIGEEFKLQSNWRNRLVIGFNSGASLGVVNKTSGAAISLINNAKWKILYRASRGW